MNPNIRLSKAVAALVLFSLLLITGCTSLYNATLERVDHRVVAG